MGTLEGVKVLLNAELGCLLTDFVKQSQNHLNFIDENNGLDYMAIIFDKPENMSFIHILLNQINHSSIYEYYDIVSEGERILLFEL